MIIVRRLACGFLFLLGSIALAKPYTSSSICAGLLTQSEIVPGEETADLSKFKYGSVQNFAQFIEDWGYKLKNFSKSKAPSMTDFTFLPRIRKRYFFSSDLDYQNYIALNMRDLNKMLARLHIDLQVSRRLKSGVHVDMLELKGEERIRDFLNVTNTYSGLLNEKICPVVVSRRPFWGGVNVLDALAFFSFTGATMASFAEFDDWDDFPALVALLGLTYISHERFAKTMGSETPGLRSIYENSYGCFRDIHFDSFQSSVRQILMKKGGGWTAYQGPLRYLKMQYFKDVLQSQKDPLATNLNRMYLDALQDRQSLRVRDVLRALSLWPKEELPFKVPTSLTPRERRRFKLPEGVEAPEPLPESEDFVPENIETWKAQISSRGIRPVQINLLFHQDENEQAVLTMYVKIYRDRAATIDPEPPAPPVEIDPSYYYHWY